MAGVKSTFADECRGFEAVQAVQWASSGELGAVDGLYGGGRTVTLDHCC